MIAKTKYHSIAEWDFSLWLALLSPLIGILFGILGRILLTTERRHKDENDKPETKISKATGTVSTATRWHDPREARPERSQFRDQPPSREAMASHRRWRLPSS